MSGCSSLTAPSSCSPSSRLPCSQMSRNARLGRRVLITASASSLSRAVRVPKPSSCRMPATSSRISLSSSTMRMSGPMVLPLARDLTQLVHGLGDLGYMRRGEAQPCPRAAAGEHARRQIVEIDAAAVVLEDAADDGEPEPGPLLAGGDVGLEQPIAILLGQADAVVEHVDEDVAALAPDRNLDAAAIELAGRHRGDRLGGVLDDVGERLGNEPAIELGRQRALRRLELDVDVGMADAHQE